jgi:signal transduction histidine kinase
MTKNYKRTIIFLFLLTITTLGFLDRDLENTKIQVGTTVDDHVIKTELVNTIFQLDNELTLLALIAAESGRYELKEKYDKREEQLRHAIEKLQAVSTNMPIGEYLKSTEVANNILVEIEQEVFRLVKEGKLQKAEDKIISNKYQKNKVIYSQSMDKYRTSFDIANNNSLQIIPSQISKLVIKVTITCLVLLVIWLGFVIFIFRNHSELQNKLFQKTKMAAIGVNTAEIVHNLKTPIVQIIYAANKIKDTDKNQKYTTIIQQASQNLAQVIETILSSTKSTNEQELVDIDLQELISTEIELYKMSNAELSNFDSHISIQGNFFFKGLPIHFTHIFNNLLENSIYSMKDSRNKKIVVIGKETENSLELEFCDTGKGISGKNIDKIFDAHYSTKSGDVSLNAGLGLAYCRKILESYGGKISVKISTEEGTCFLITLPKNSEMAKKDL